MPDSKSTSFEKLKKVMTDIKNQPSFESLKVDPMTYIEYKKSLGTKVHSTSTEGQASSGFTSTKMQPITQNKLRTLSDDEIRKDFYHLVRSR